MEKETAWKFCQDWLCTGDAGADLHKGHLGGQGRPWQPEVRKIRTLQILGPDLQLRPVRWQDGRRGCTQGRGAHSEACTASLSRLRLSCSPPPPQSGSVCPCAATEPSALRLPDSAAASTPGSHWCCGGTTGAAVAHSSKDSNAGRANSRAWSLACLHNCLLTDHPGAPRGDPGVPSLCCRIERGLLPASQGPLATPAGFLSSSHGSAVACPSHSPSPCSAGTGTQVSDTPAPPVRGYGLRAASLGASMTWAQRPYPGQVCEGESPLCGDTEANCGPLTPPLRVCWAHGLISTLGWGAVCLGASLSPFE